MAYRAPEVNLSTEEAARPRWSVRFLHTVCGSEIQSAERGDPPRNTLLGQSELRESDRQYGNNPAHGGRFGIFPYSQPPAQKGVMSAPNTKTDRTICPSCDHRDAGCFSLESRNQPVCIRSFHLPGNNCSN